MTPDELKNQIADLTAQADALNNKQDKTPEDVTKLEELVTQIEELQKQLDAANAQQRFIAAKERMNAPTRPAPVIERKHYATAKAPQAGEALALFLGNDKTPDGYYKARSAGIDLGSNRFSVPMNFNRLNYKNRTIMSKGGVGSGAELVWQSYSDKVSEYLALSSPILSLVASETTSDGNNRTYFRIDDTSMEATYTSASGGTETVPTIPDTNLSTDNVVIACFDLTSGYQKISFNELRDSAVNLEEKIARANANSFARKMERELFTASGDGSSGVQGISQVATDYGNQSDWEKEYVEAFYFNFPAQYRANAIFACNPDTYKDLYANLKDSTGRTLFDKDASQGLEYDVLFGKKIIVSSYIADNTLYMFDPEKYMLRLVNNQIFQRFDEKFFPNVAWAAILSFGGAWIGDADACWKMTVTTGSVD